MNKLGKIQPSILHLCSSEKVNVIMSAKYYILWLKTVIAQLDTEEDSPIHQMIRKTGGSKKLTNSGIASRANNGRHSRKKSNRPLSKSKLHTLKKRRNCNNVSHASVVKKIRFSLPESELVINTQSGNAPAIMKANVTDDKLSKSLSHLPCKKSICNDKLYVQLLKMYSDEEGSCNGPCAHQASDCDYKERDTDEEKSLGQTPPPSVGITGRMEYSAQNYPYSQNFTQNINGKHLVCTSQSDDNEISKLLTQFIKDSLDIDLHRTKKLMPSAHLYINSSAGPPVKHSLSTVHEPSCSASPSFSTPNESDFGSYLSRHSPSLLSDPLLSHSSSSSASVSKIPFYFGTPKYTTHLDVSSPSFISILGEKILTLSEEEMLKQVSLISPLTPDHKQSSFPVLGLSTPVFESKLDVTTLLYTDLDLSIELTNGLSLDMPLDCIISPR